jgi:hypothetical protein
VRWVHSNQFICMALKVTPQASYVDIIGPSDIACVIAIIKNIGEMWDQDIRMKELGDKAMGKQEKRMRSLFTQGDGQKRMKGESLWNKEGMRFFQVQKRNGRKYTTIRRVCLWYTISGRSGLRRRGRE